MPLILAPVALDVVQVSNAYPPAFTLEGEALNDVTTGAAELAGGGVAAELPTFICTCDLIEPDLLVAVKTYVVVVAGATLSVPMDGTDGIPGSILTEDASSISHDSMEASPVLIVTGLPSNLITLGALLLPPISIVMQPPAVISNTKAIRTIFLIKHRPA